MKQRKSTTREIEDNFKKRNKGETNKGWGKNRERTNTADMETNLVGLLVARTPKKTLINHKFSPVIFAESLKKQFTPMSTDHKRVAMCPRVP